MHPLGTLEISGKTVCDKEQGYWSYRERESRYGAEEMSRDDVQ